MGQTGMITEDFFFFLIHLIYFSLKIKFEKNGYAVLEDFFSLEEVEEMKACGEEFTRNLPPENERPIFNTVELQQVRFIFFFFKLFSESKFVVTIYYLF